MQLRLIKVAIVQILTAIVLMLCVFFAYCEIADRRAQSKAESICSAIPDGASDSDVAAMVLKIDSDFTSRSESDSNIAIGFRGALLDKWFCHLAFKQGVVVGHETYFLD